MHPDEGKRAIALLVDWTSTADRIVECSAQDLSSDKTFGDQYRMTESDARDAITWLHATLVGALTEKGKIERNEVRTVQVRKSALIGLIWNPSKQATALSEGRAEWSETREKVVSFMGTLRDAGVAPNGLPVFGYSVGSNSMSLTYRDFVA